MPSITSHSSTLAQSLPADRVPPKSPQAVLAEAEAQWIFSDEDMRRSPSILDGMEPETEHTMRSKGVNFIMQVGIMLKLPQLTLTTASTFFNRFLMRHSLVDKPGVKALHHYQIAATALFLASKVEENCRKMKELVVACCRVAQKNPNLMIDEQSKDYWRWRDTVLFNEDVLLEALCFDLTVESPHKILFDMLKRYGVEHNKKLRNAAWAFLNDSILTTLCLRFPSRTIAVAALYCAAKHCGDVAFLDDETGRPWWEMQHVTLRDVRRACNHMASSYEHVQNKPGGDEPSIYVGLRTPEYGDDVDAKTRLRRQQTPMTPPPSQQLQPPSSTTGNASATARQGSADASSERGAKRERPGADDSANGNVDAHHLAPPNGDGAGNGHITANPAGAERSPKRARTKGVDSETEAAAAPPSPAKDELSEEGELEE